jgi:hypothetical protein
MTGQGASSAVQQQGVAARDKDIALCEYFMGLLINDLVLLRNSVCC